MKHRLVDIEGSVVLYLEYYNMDGVKTQQGCLDSGGDGLSFIVSGCQQTPLNVSLITISITITEVYRSIAKTTLFLVM